MPSGKRVVGETQAGIVSRIRDEMRKADDMKQSALARQSGIPETTLSKILNGDSVLDVEQAGLIANVFDLDLWELVTPRSIPRRYSLRNRRTPRQTGRTARTA